MLHNLERLYKAEFYFWILDVRNIKIKVLEILASGKVNFLIYYNNRQIHRQGYRPHRIRHTDLQADTHRPAGKGKGSGISPQSYFWTVQQKNGILPEIMLLLTYQSWLWGLPNIWYHRIVLPHSLFPCQESVTL